MKARLLTVVFVAASQLLVVYPSFAQTVAEVRIADTRYRFADVSFTAKNNVVLDLFYVGVPGSDELNAGGGYALKRGALTLTPLVYAVIGKQDGERGIKTALLTTSDKSGWKLAAFLGAFFPTSGAIDAYQVLDTADLTRTLRTRWELGVQAGFFHAGGSWNSQIGPLVKRNDARGAWAVSYRFGQEKEFRVGRVFVF